MDTYATVQDIRDRGVDPSVAAVAAVRQALARATIVIDTYCGRNFWKRDETYLVDGTGRSTLFLNDWPIIEITDLKMDDYPVPSESFRVYGEAGYIRFVGGRSIFAGHPGIFPRGAQNVEVRGFFGFEDVPPEVKEACIILALAFLRMMAAEVNVGEQLANTTDKAIGIKRVKVDELSVEFQYPREATVGASRKKTTGVIEADRLLWRHRRDLEAMVI